MPRMGMGLPLSATAARASILLIDDPLFESFGGQDIAINYTATRTNTAQYSQDATQSQWVKTSTAIEGTLYKDPDSNTTANAITGAASNSTKFIHQVQSITAGETYTYSAYAKKGTLNFILLEVSDGTTTYSANFDLNSGGIGTTTRLITSAIDDRSDGWYRCSITFQALNTSEAGQIRAYGLYADNTPTVNIAVADTVLIYIWGQQFEADGEPTDYIVTVGASRSATTTLIDNSKTWDFDGNDIMPEADPDAEGTWEVNTTDLVTNGTFDADANWTKGTGWTISGGKAHVDCTSTAAFTQDFTLGVGNVYFLEFTISNYVAGQIQPQFDGTVMGQAGSNGSHSFYVTATDVGTRLYLYALGTSELSIDDVSLTEYAITPLDV